MDEAILTGVMIYNINNLIDIKYTARVIVYFGTIYLMEQYIIRKYIEERYQEIENIL